MKTNIIKGILSSFVLILSAVILPQTAAFADFDCGTYDSGNYGADCPATATTTSTTKSSTTGTSTTVTSTPATTTGTSTATTTTGTATSTTGTTDTTGTTNPADTVATTAKKVGTAWWPLILFGALVLIIGGVWLVASARRRAAEEKAQALQAAQNPQNPFI